MPIERAADRGQATSLTLPVELCRELERLSLLHGRPVPEIIRHAVELHYGDAAVSARHRLVDRLARLEAGLGEAETLQDQIAESLRKLRAL